MPLITAPVERIYDGFRFFIFCGRHPRELLTRCGIASDFRQARDLVARLRTVFFCLRCYSRYCGLGLSQTRLDRRGIGCLAIHGFNRLVCFAGQPGFLACPVLFRPQRARYLRGPGPRSTFGPLQCRTPLRHCLGHGGGDRHRRHGMRQPPDPHGNWVATFIGPLFKQAFWGRRDGLWQFTKSKLIREPETFSVCHTDVSGTAGKRSTPDPTPASLTGLALREHS